MKVITRAKAGVLTLQRMSSTDFNGEDTIAELEVMKKLHHPYIVRLHEVINDPSVNKIYVIMDLLPGGTVLSKL